MDIHEQEQTLPRRRILVMLRSLDCNDFEIYLLVSGRAGASNGIDIEFARKPQAGFHHSCGDCY